MSLSVHLCMLLGIPHITHLINPHVCPAIHHSVYLISHSHHYFILHALVSHFSLHYYMHLFSNPLTHPLNIIPSFTQHTLRHSPTEQEREGRWWRRQWGQGAQPMASLHPGASCPLGPPQEGVWWSSCCQGAGAHTGESVTKIFVWYIVDGELFCGGL